MNRLRAENLEPVETFFETTHVQAPFATGPVYEKEEDVFEKNQWAEELSIDGFQISEVENINAPDTLDHLRKLRPDFGIVFGTRRLSQEILNLFPDGLINLHRGYPQFYRGIDSELWAIYHRDWDHIGMTLHIIDADLDTGAIVEQRRVALAPGMKCHQIRYYASEQGCEMVLAALSSYTKGQLVAKRQEKQGRYYSFMPLDLKKLMQRRFDKYCEGL